MTDAAVKRAYQYEYNRRPEVKARYLKRQRERKAYAKARRLFTTYGLSLVEYDKMVALQHSRCGICGTHQSQLYHPLAVDHCHVTGKVRGLLCTGCNVRLGTLEDRAFRMVAEAYLADTIK